MQDGGATLREWLEAGARERKTFSLTITTDEGMGRIYVSMGEIVHAIYGHWGGEAAVDAMLAAPGVEFEAVLDPRRQTLPPPLPKPLALLPAGAGQRTSAPPAVVSMPRTRSTPPSQRLPILAHSTTPPPVSVEARLNKPVPYAALAGVLAIGAVAGFAFQSIGGTRSEAKPQPAGADAAERTGVTAARAAASVVAPASSAALPTAAAFASAAPGAAASPVTASSAAASAPSAVVTAPSASVPTVVVRLVVGADGRPSAARVAGSNLDPKLFEQAAMSAAKKLEFRPALRAGVPIEAEIDWPVSFRADPGP